MRNMQNSEWTGKIFLVLLLNLSIVNSSYTQENRITKITILGNKKTKYQAIQKQLTVEKGTELDSVRIQKDIRWLKRLPAFQDVYYEIQPKDLGYEVVYKVVERTTLIPSLNVYTTNKGELAFRIGLTEYNLFGQHIVLGAMYQYDIYSSYQSRIRLPFLFNKKTGLALSHSNFTTEEPIFLSQGTADYKYNNTAFELLLLHRFNFFHRIEVGGNYFNEAYDYKRGATAAGVPTSFDINKFLCKGTYAYNNLDFNYQYVAGFRSVLNLQYVISAQSRFPDFIIGWNDFLYYERWGSHGNWANRLRLGLASNAETPFAPFAIDNNLNIRGVGNRIDRGTGVVVWNTEYRHTLLNKKGFALQSNFFVDAGSWRNPGGDFDDFLDSKNFRVYPGIGLRLIYTPIFNAIFRIDYGFGITQDATQGFVFGIGQYF